MRLLWLTILACVLAGCDSSDLNSRHDVAFVGEDFRYYAASADLEVVIRPAIRYVVIDKYFLFPQATSPYWPVGNRCHGWPTIIDRKAGTRTAFPQPTEQARYQHDGFGMYGPTWHRQVIDESTQVQKDGTTLVLTDDPNFLYVWSIPILSTYREPGHIHVSIDRGKTFSRVPNFNPDLPDIVLYSDHKVLLMFDMKLKAGRLVSPGYPLPMFALLELQPDGTVDYPLDAQRQDAIDWDAFAEIRGIDFEKYRDSIWDRPTVPLSFSPGQTIHFRRDRGSREYSFKFPQLDRATEIACPDITFGEVKPPH